MLHHFLWVTAPRSAVVRRVSCLSRRAIVVTGGGHGCWSRQHQRVGYGGSSVLALVSLKGPFKLARLQGAQTNLPLFRLTVSTSEVPTRKPDRRSACALIPVFLGIVDTSGLGVLVPATMISSAVLQQNASAYPHFGQHRWERGRSEIPS
ncbi:uncharacterized protein IWZ02DRAFT_33528 [Phyllosticta citriasiana]|uniref:uncharacterized protein n=1 Tax=Phyllosticta citriasiana TaxID=595635 RepID=UPI0030FDBACF